ncbi:TIGR04376 family protein [Phormidium pseudopriestleyi FRX01]|uniref:TIGR04376 family protein n=1 Tax=Phormidium pseudopriestleyi FRX01 TaxID=1759528 RepID=A0ABS3FP82_9CYAN|nr:TIGR04376 family protein [Phormidium pseudopriestleyi]MBO0348922.1 TIGR04376 family protein [Phormidium pseudopriestleyi FRX01]
MGLFEDMSRFLETRLEEFMRNNPHLELQVLEEQLREQEEDTLKLILELQRKEKQLQDSILSTAQEIQLWHDRVSKAKAANREDLVRAAQEREASLLREGNQFWGQMQGVKERIEKAKDLYRQIQVRRREVKAKSVEAETARAQTKTETSWDTGWNKNYNRSFNSGADPLDQEFRRWEADEELERLKRNMKR